MCGILVVIEKNNKTVDIENCKKALRELNKRGPDWFFYKKIKNIFFGQTVLSMTGKEKKNINNHISFKKNYLALFNGEIYNYRYLLKENKLVTNRDPNDTNVLVNLFEKKKISKIIKEIDGMYALVVYNSVDNKIYISRDPQGEKSLYFFENHEKIIISSEIGPIIKLLNKVEINYEILQSYFNSRHFIQFDKTIYKNIDNVEPGETIEIDLNNFKNKKLFKLSLGNFVDEKKYFHNLKRKEEDLVEELEFLIIKNLKEMIPENGNFCSITSGGIDSTLISYYLSKISNPKKYLAINHIGKDRISNQINLFQNYFNHNIISKNVDVFDYEKFLKKSIDVCKSPINSHDFPGKLILAKTTNSLKCKSIFGGDGADELFGGYETYRQTIKNKKINNSNYSKFINSRFKAFNINNGYFSKKLKNHWKKNHDIYSFIKNSDERYRQSMMLTDSTIQLSSVGLRGCDLMFMNYSVEPRSLFLRKDIVNFALNLPLKYKIDLSNKKYLKTKIILKKLFLKHFSKDLIFKKQGFSGFPNETIKFLGNHKNFILFEFLDLDKNSFRNFQKFNNEEKWKICNLEFFLRKL